tara:strand:- start:17492 stop:18415 length:924 start_codon:yes stop_codon:yes gene_type:complete
MLIDLIKVKDKLNKIRTGEITEGKKIGIPDIDNYIRFKEGNFNVILGHANVGKTTVILYLMLLYAKRLNIRWLVFSSENEPHSIYRKLVEFLEQKPITQVTEKQFNTQMDYINDYFKVIDNNNLYTYRHIIELATSYKKAWNYGGLLIDPYNSLIKDPEIMKSLGGHEYDYQATTEIRKFCKTYNVSTWLNTHANTAALRMKHPMGHEYAGHPIPPMASDVEGGGKFVNRADDFMVIHRYIQHPADWTQSHIHVRKVKEIETGGKPTSMDDPIRFQSMAGNVGFQINGNVILEKPIREEFKKVINLK